MAIDDEDDAVALSVFDLRKMKMADSNPQAFLEWIAFSDIRPGNNPVSRIKKGDGHHAVAQNPTMAGGASISPLKKALVVGIRPPKFVWDLPVCDCPPLIDYLGLPFIPRNDTAAFGHGDDDEISGGVADGGVIQKSFIRRHEKHGRKSLVWHGVRLLEIMG